MSFHYFLWGNLLLDYEHVSRMIHTRNSRFDCTFKLFKTVVEGIMMNGLDIWSWEEQVVIIKVGDKILVVWIS